MKKRILIPLAFTALVLVLWFIVGSIRNASKRNAPAEPIPLNAAALVLYGRVEPEGLEIRLSPSVSGTVKAVFVTEGQLLRRGQVLLLLDDAVLRAERAAVAARLDLARKSVELSRDQWNRGEALYKGESLNAAEYVRLKNKLETDEAELRLRLREFELADTRLGERSLESPIDGRLYKFDVRPGEFLSTGQGRPIIVGSSRLEIRCDVEPFWIGRIDSSAGYRVFHAETNQPLGSAVFKSVLPYLRPKKLRTEDAQERLLSDYQEAVFQFKSDLPNPPIGLPVYLKHEGK